MTPLPSRAELAQRYILDPASGDIHIRDLINYAKDGIYAKDKLSDHVIGMILWAQYINEIEKWEGTLFQVPFVKSMKLRSRTAHLGRPFTGPDSLVLTLAGRTLHGSNQDLPISPLNAVTLLNHPQYNNWLRDTLYAGRAVNDTTYVRVRTNDSLTNCDTYVNSIQYTPGPLSTLPATGPNANTTFAHLRTCTIL